MTNDRPKDDKPKMGVIDITEFASLPEDEQVEKVKELLRMIAPKRPTAD